MHNFKRDDVVEFKSGNTYVVGFQQDGDSERDTIGVCGWKNGRAFGAYRRILVADCKLIGRRVPSDDGAAWEFQPLTDTEAGA